jgi:hypothetical protein
MDKDTLARHPIVRQVNRERGLSNPEAFYRILRFYFRPERLSNHSIYQLLTGRFIRSLRCIQMNCFHNDSPLRQRCTLDLPHFRAMLLYSR